VNNREAPDLARALIALAIPIILVGGYGHRTEATALGTVLLVVALIALRRTDH
jgi:hypothetical protein